MFELTASMITWKPFWKKPLFPKNYPTPLILSKECSISVNPLPYVCVFTFMWYTYGAHTHVDVLTCTCRSQRCCSLSGTLLILFIYLFVSWDKIYHWDLHLTNKVKLADQQVLGTWLSLSPHCWDYDYVSSCLLSHGF